MADKEIRVGDIVSGAIPNPEGRWYVNGSDQLVLEAPNGHVIEDVLTLQDTLNIDDAAASPAANGEITLNGSDLEAFSGGSVRSLSDIRTNEAVQDIVGALVVGGADINVTYDDGANTLTIAYNGLSGVAVEDNGTQVLADSTAINFNANVSVTDDGDGTVTVDATDTDTRTDASDSGALVVSDVTDINFDQNLTVTDDTDGTVTVDASTGGTNTPNYTEDGNSPLTSSGQQSHTITLSGTYDRVLVIIDYFRDTSGAGQGLRMEVNGDTGANYNFIDFAGTTTSGANFIELAGNAAPSDIEISGDLLLDGAWGNDFTMNGSYGSNDLSTVKAQIGNNTNVTSPLDSITFAGSAGNTEINARVYGLTL